jgi:DNA repair exonuclease SbcCD ATPase subunit
MRLRALELDQFRKFDRPVRIEGLADGLNLIVGPNEMGKSTLLAALVAALFEKHRSSAKAVQSFQPSRHRTAPQVALDFEIGAARYRIEKQFLKRPHARLHMPDGSRIDGDDAEAELEKLLAFDPAERRSAGDVWGVLWVAQGQLGLPAFGEGARATLQVCLDAELGQAVGDDQGPALRAAIDAALLELVDRRGKPRARYLELERELAGLSSEIDRDQQRTDELEQDLARLEQDQRVHEELMLEQASRDDPAALAAARAERDALVTLAARVREAEAAQAIARQTLLQAEKDAAERARLVEELAAIEAQTRQAAGAEAETSAQVAASAAALTWQQDEVARLEGLRTQRQRRSAGLRNLRRLIRQADDNRAALDARATEVTVTLETDALARVQIGGRPALRLKQTVQAVDPVEIAIEGVGQIGIRPRVAQAERWRRDLAGAEHQIRALLRELELVRDAPARASDQLSLFGPGSDRPPDLATVEGLAAETDRLVEELVGKLDAARPELDQRLENQRRVDLAAARAKAQIEQVRERLGQLQRKLVDAEEAASTAELGEAVTAARETLEQATAEVARLREGDPGAALTDVEARITQLEQGIEQRRNRLGDLRTSIEGLQARVRLHAGEGFAERLDGARRRFGEAEREHAKCRREVEVLQLLRSTLAEAELEAKERYLAPVALRIRPYLQDLFPDAEIAVDETLQITSVRRDGAGDEPFEQLSEGTREQIAILVRLALAELLCEQGLPAVVVLDDALVFSDDERIQRMFRILERAAERLQILVLTCRERLFEGLAGKRLHLELAGSATEARGAA